VKTLPAGLQAHLDSGSTTLCHCWRVQRQDGTVFGFTDHDRTLTFAGVDYEPESGFTASEAVSNLGLAVDSMEIEGGLSSDMITETDIARGLWDNAKIEVYRVNWSSVAQRVITRKGSLGEISRGDIDFTAEIRGLAHELQQETGRTYQRPCDAVIGDTRCGVNLANPDFSGSGTVVDAIDDRIMTVDGLDAFDESWFFLGRLTWTSGANDGAVMKISGHLIAHDGSIGLQLWERAALPIEVGDTFTITAGCSNTFDVCNSKFANGVNFRGFPHMPGNDFVLSLAKKTTQNDGGSFFNA
jgi:uncharacterized phage protein (TIGR02218 family)